MEELSRPGMSCARDEGSDDDLDQSSVGGLVDGHGGFKANNTVGRNLKS